VVKRDAAAGAAGGGNRQPHGRRIRHLGVERRAAGQPRDAVIGHVGAPPRGRIVAARRKPDAKARGLGSKIGEGCWVRRQAGQGRRHPRHRRGGTARSQKRETRQRRNCRIALAAVRTGGGDRGKVMVGAGLAPLHIDVLTTGDHDRQAQPDGQQTLLSLAHAILLPHQA